MSLLELKNVKSEVEGKEILKGLNLTINKRRSSCNYGGLMEQENLHLQVFLWDIQNMSLLMGKLFWMEKIFNEDAVDERAKKGFSYHSIS